MFGDSLKRSRFFTMLLCGLSVCIFYVAAQPPASRETGSLSNFQKRFVKSYLRAEQGLAEAQYSVGMMYYSGWQMPQDSKLAIIWLTKAARQGHADAQYFLSLMYGLGDGVDQDNQSAVRWCRDAADQGHVDAQYALGQMYSMGQGVPQDNTQAVTWLTKAAEQGHAWSALMLQEAMQRSDFSPVAVGSSNKEADKLINFLGEDLGLLDATELVATIDGMSDTPHEPVNPQSDSMVRRDEKLSEDIDPIIAEDTPSPIVSQEGPVAVLPKEVPAEKNKIDPAKAGVIEDSPDRPIQIVEMENASAQFDLAVTYYEGQETPRDYAQAIKWFHKAAEQGHGGAQYKLGVMYSFGQGVTQNSAEAVKWFRKAAKQKLPEAQYCLGVMYGTGQGVPLDAAEAVKWYTLAANQGSVSAQFMLGMVYSKGQGVTRDSSTAVQWYTKAAEQGAISAQYMLGVIYEKGQGVVIRDSEEALKWYTRSAEGGHAESQYDLAIKYMTGKGAEKDFVKAYTWCLVAALNKKNVAREQKWLETVLTADQLEEARQRARQILEDD